MSDHLGMAFPNLAGRLQKLPIASLPTPVSQHEIETPGGRRSLFVKHDDLTHGLYGGNKIRKLEYIFRRALDRGAKRVATFGTVGSNHALATAVHARELGLSCTCFLAHQVRTPKIPQVLNRHLQLGTELVRWGGGVDRLEIYRRYLHREKTWVIPLGGSCWLGALGFVNAGLELAAQVAAGELDPPDRIYIANGTMGSVAGLAIGLALARLPAEIHAVRVADNRFVKRDVLDRLMRKTLSLMHRYDAAVPLDVIADTRIAWREAFYAGGYAAVDEPTQDAVRFAGASLGLDLDTTYTGKAMAALLHDLQSGDAQNSLFWNTYNSRPLGADSSRPGDAASLPPEFLRYFEGIA